MAKSDFEEKKTARKENYERLAVKNNDASLRLSKESRDMVSVIPMGQPILIGHHSEKGHRSLLDRSWNKLGQSVEAGKKAAYYEEKAASITHNNSISSDDPEAIGKLKKKLAELEKSQTIMRNANVICRSKKLSDEQKYEQLEKLGISNKYACELLNPSQSYYKKGFQSYSLTNNNANIKRVKRRIEKLELESSLENKEEVFKDIKIVDDVQDNRLRLYFDGKPEEEVRKQLKYNGFRWSPKFGCWQAYRSASFYKLPSFKRWYLEYKNM